MLLISKWVPCNIPHINTPTKERKKKKRKKKKKKERKKERESIIHTSKEVFYGRKREAFQKKTYLLVSPQPAED